MKYTLTGARAGTIGALILTLWSFLGVMGPLEEASEASGLLYVATAFGVLGLPQIAFGAVLGVTSGSRASQSPCSIGALRRASSPLPSAQRSLPSPSVACISS